MSVVITVVNVKGLNTPDKRAAVTYVGRAFAGWPASPLANRFKGPHAVGNFARWLTLRPDRVELLAATWEACDRGAKPLGCWCVSAPWVVNRVDVPTCHGQVIAVQMFDLVEAGLLPRPTTGC